MSFETTALLVLFVGLILRISIEWVKRPGAAAMPTLRFDLDRGRGSGRFAPVAGRGIISRHPLHEALARWRGRRLLLLNYRENERADETTSPPDGSPGASFGIRRQPLEVWDCYKARPDPPPRP
jgi:hypothetical protein